MASKRGVIQTKLASAGLKIAQKADGDSITYSHEGATGATLTASIGGAVLNPRDDFGNVIDGELRTFGIPLQTNFAGAVSLGDEITWNSLLYVVSSCSVDKWGAKYTVTAIYNRTNRTKG